MKKKQRKGGDVKNVHKDFILKPEDNTSKNYVNSENIQVEAEEVINDGSKRFPKVNTKEELDRMNEVFKKNSSDPNHIKNMILKEYVEDHNKKHPENHTTLEIELKKSDDLEKRTKELLEKIEKEKEEKEKEENQTAKETSQGGKKKRKTKRKPKKASKKTRSRR